MKTFALIATAAALVSASAATAATRPGQAMPAVGKSVRAAAPAKKNAELAAGLLPIILAAAAVAAVAAVAAASGGGQSNG